MAADDEGFCKVSDSVGCSIDSSKYPYWKVTNPTLSPVHLEGGPFSRDLPEVNNF